MAPVVNVVRYSALAGGIVYGAWHRRTLQRQADAAAEEAERQKRQGWADQAKKLFGEKYGKAVEKAADAIPSFENLANFKEGDLERWLKSFGDKSS